MIAELQKQLACLTSEDMEAIWKPAIHAWMRTLTIGHALERI
jgi:hypothetical protein